MVPISLGRRLGPLVSYLILFVLMCTVTPYSCAQEFKITLYISISLNFVQSKYIKRLSQECPLLGRHPFGFFCIPLYINYLSVLHKKLQVASTYYINVECQIWCFCYADNKHTQRPTVKNGIFGFRGLQNTSKFQFRKLTRKQYFLCHAWIKEKEKTM